MGDYLTYVPIDINLNQKCTIPYCPYLPGGKYSIRISVQRRIKYSVGDGILPPHPTFIRINIVRSTPRANDANDENREQIRFRQILQSTTRVIPYVRKGRWYAARRFQRKDEGRPIAAGVADRTGRKKCHLTVGFGVRQVRIR